MSTLTSPITTAKPSDLVFISQTNELVTDSFHVSRFFGKQHKDVLRKLKSLDCSFDFTKRNFTLCHKNNELQNGKLQPFYQMTKDGFMFLVMGFTGKRAAEIKERYINAFNEMAEQLANRKPTMPTVKIPDFARLRILITVENGVTTQTKLLDNDELIINRNNLDYYMRDPEVFPVEQLIQSHQTFNARLEDFMRSKLRR
ncbi:MAG: Rha family transcriptional regulator [Vibrio sp.]